MSHTDPADNPGGYLTDVARQYIPPGYVTSLIRTIVPIGVGSVLAWLAVHWHIVIDPGASATVGIVAAAVVTAGYYAAARVVERRWPTVGRWLVALNLVAARPVYAAPSETVRVIDKDTGTVRRG